LSLLTLPFKLLGNLFLRNCAVENPDIDRQLPDTLCSIRKRCYHQSPGGSYGVDHDHAAPTSYGERMDLNGSLRTPIRTYAPIACMVEVPGACTTHLSQKHATLPAVPENMIFDQESTYLGITCFQTY